MPQKLIEYGTRFGMQRGATMNLAPNELKMMFFGQTSTLTLNMH